MDLLTTINSLNKMKLEIKDTVKKELLKLNDLQLPFYGRDLVEDMENIDYYAPMMLNIDNDDYYTLIGFKTEDTNELGVLVSCYIWPTPNEKPIGDEETLNAKEKYLYCGNFVIPYNYDVFTRWGKDDYLHLSINKL
jgi:hypothetical protein